MGGGGEPRHKSVAHTLFQLCPYHAGGPSCHLGSSHTILNKQTPAFPTSTTGSPPLGETLRGHHSLRRQPRGDAQQTGMCIGTQQGPEGCPAQGDLQQPLLPRGN